MNKIMIRFRRLVVPILTVTVGILILILVVQFLQPILTHIKMNDLKQAYLEKQSKFGVASEMTVEDVYIHDYCGTYHGCVVAKISDPQTLYTTAIYTEEVAGVRFVYPNSNTLIAWNGDDFYTLTEAYENGLLTIFDIVCIKIIYLFG